MAVFYPDIIEHNNPNLAAIDSDFVRGGRRVVESTTELYSLIDTFADQLKEDVTVVHVRFDSTDYRLIDKNNAGNASGWAQASFNELDPVFTSSIAYGITSQNITDWNTAFGWGDHTEAGYAYLVGGNEFLGLQQITMGGMLIGAGTLSSSAIFQVNSTTHGVLFPRMTQLQRDTINLPELGLLLYQTNNSEGYYVNTSVGYKRLLFEGDVVNGNNLVSDYDSDIDGLRNGINKVFIMSSPFDPNSTKVYLNGVRQNRGAANDYIELNQYEIEFVVAPEPDAVITVDYVPFGTNAGEQYGPISSHMHSISEIAGLQTKLDEKVSVLAAGIDGQILKMVGSDATWVDPGIISGSARPIRTVGTNDSYVSTDCTVLVNTSASNITITIGTISTGHIGYIKKVTKDTNKVTVINSTGLIEGRSSYILEMVNETIQFQYDGTDLYILNK